MDKKYMDIINLDYKPSLKHPRMPRQNRACQFQAFKALRGYEERIYESSKEKIKKHLASDQKDLINYRLSEIISGKIKKNYKFVFFKRDDSFIYGKYENVCGKVQKNRFLWKNYLFRKRREDKHRRFNSNRGIIKTFF